MMKTRILAALSALILGSTILVAQTTTVQDVKSTAAPKTEIQKDSVSYNCPMHAEMKMDKAGKCPKCGATLEKTTVSSLNQTVPAATTPDAIKTYTCTMHPEVSADKPGKCPKCGMDMVEKK